MSRQVTTDLSSTWLKNAARLDKAGKLLEMPLKFSEFAYAHTDLPKDHTKFATDYFDNAICDLDANLAPLSGDYLAISLDPTEFRRAVMTTSDDTDDHFIWSICCTRDYRSWAAALIRLQRYQQAAASLRAISQLYASSINGSQLPHDAKEITAFLSTALPGTLPGPSGTVDSAYPRFSSLFSESAYRHHLVVAGAADLVDAFKSIEDLLWRRIAHVWNWACTEPDRMKSLQSVGLLAELRNSLEPLRNMVGRISHRTSTERITHAWVDAKYQVCGLSAINDRSYIYYYDCISKPVPAILPDLTIGPEHTFVRSEEDTARFDAIMAVRRQRASVALASPGAHSTTDTSRTALPGVDIAAPAPAVTQPLARGGSDDPDGHGTLAGLIPAASFRALGDAVQATAHLAHTPVQDPVHHTGPGAGAHPTHSPAPAPTAAAGGPTAPLLPGPPPAAINPAPPVPLPPPQIATHFGLGGPTQVPTAAYGLAPPAVGPPVNAAMAPVMPLYNPATAAVTMDATTPGLTPHQTFHSPPGWPPGLVPLAPAPAVPAPSATQGATVAAAPTPASTQAPPTRDPQVAHLVTQLRQLQQQTTAMQAAMAATAASQSAAHAPAGTTIATMPKYRHLFDTAPPPGAIFHMYGCETRATFPTVASVPVWSFDYSTARDAVTKPLQHMRFKDVPSFQRGGAVEAFTTFAGAIYNELDSCDLSPYVFTTGYDFPTDTQHIRTFCAFQAHVMQLIRSALQSSRSASILEEVRQIRMPSSRSYLTHEHNGAFRLLAAIKKHILSQATPDTVKTLRKALGDAIEAQWRYWDDYYVPIKAVCQSLAELGELVDLSEVFRRIAVEMWIESRVDYQATQTFEHQARKVAQSTIFAFIERNSLTPQRLTWSALRAEMTDILGQYCLMTGPGGPATPFQTIPGMHASGEADPIAAMRAAVTPTHLPIDDPILAGGDPQAHPAYFYRSHHTGPSPRGSPRASVMTMPYVRSASTHGRDPGRGRSHDRDRSRSRSRGRDERGYRGGPSHRPPPRGTSRSRSPGRERSGYQTYGSYGDGRQSPFRPPPSSHVSSPPSGGPRPGDHVPSPGGPALPFRPQGEAQSTRPRTQTDVRCFLCGKAGHMVGDCPLKDAALELDRKRRADPHSASAHPAVRDLVGRERVASGLPYQVDRRQLSAHLAAHQPDVDHTPTMLLFR